MDEPIADAIAFDVSKTDWEGACSELQLMAGLMVCLEVGGRDALSGEVSGMGVLSEPKLQREDDLELLTLEVGPMGVSIDRRDFGSGERTAGYARLDFGGLFVSISRWVKSGPWRSR